MEEQSIYEALGLEGENEQEPAEPAAGETEETAAPGTAEPEQETAPEEAPETEQEEPAREREQTPEERGRQAHGRRQRELEAAVSAARAAERAGVDRLLKSLGIKNPETGEAVDTLDGLEAYERLLSTRRIENGNPSEADIRRIVREETQRQPQPEAPKEPSPEEVRAIVDRQIAEIRQLDPSVRSLDGILKSEVGAAFRQYVAENPGKNFVEAYRAVAGQRISAARQAAAEQTARNRIDSKSHLSGTVTRGQGSSPVPRAELEIFRALMPDISDSEFEKYYNKK